jgi:predicted regulator of Ras-like GTPase activity (Roadblock/LC7/MglB family)
MSSIGMLSVEDQGAIEECLKEFLSKAESNWAALVDRGGNLFAEHGDIGSLDMSILCALAAGSFSATRELARRLGEKEFTALYHEGGKVSILMTSLKFDCLLITVFGESTNIGLVRFYSQQTSERLNEALKRASETSSQAEPLQVDTEMGSGNTPIIS